MNYYGNNDYFEVTSSTLVSDVDVSIIVRLYQPLIGYKASMLYLTLASFSSIKNLSFDMISELLKITQMDISSFSQSMNALEAIGLVKTYLSTGKSTKKFLYVVYPPLSPNDFFKDTLYRGLLVRYLGEKDTTKLAMLFQVDISLDGYQDVSASFIDAFHPELDGSEFDFQLPLALKDHAPLIIHSDFTINDFLTRLKPLMVNEKAFSKQELDSIERIATLYALGPDIMADKVMEIFDESKPKGQRVDIVALNESAINESKYQIINKKNEEKKSFVKISGKTKLASEIDLMTDCSPREYLQIKQNGVPLSTPDLNIISTLANKFHLSFETINALIYYTLKMCDNRLSRNYIEKVASTLIREKINTAVDALDYLEKKKSKTKDFVSPIKKEENLTESKESNNDEENVSEEDIKKLLEDMAGSN